MIIRQLMFMVIAGLLMTSVTVHAQDGLERISEHVYAYVDRDAAPANSFGANAGIVVGDTAIAVVDSLISAREAHRLLADIRKVSDKPIRYLINTHGHLDHVFGNGVFAAEGATIIAQRECGRQMQARLADTLAQADAHGLTPEDLQGTTLAYPDLTFERSLRIDLGGIDVALLYAGPSHSPGSILVHIPEEQVVFAGDMLFTDFYPYMGAGDIAGWLANLAVLQNLGAQRIVPGHGPLSGAADVRAMTAYLKLFDAKARELAAAGATPDAAAAALKQVLPVRSQAEGLIRASLPGKYMPAE